MGPQREVSPELKAMIVRELPDNVAHKVFDLIYHPCDQDLICTYIEKLDDWVTWVDAWLEKVVPDGDKVDKKPKPTWPPEE